MASSGKILIIVENLPVPFDRRVWMEATTLRDAGYEVSVICPQGRNYTREREDLDGIHIFRHPLPPDISSARGYLNEYATALRWEFKLARKAFREIGFDAIQMCNPPDLIFLVASWFKFRHGVRVIFDHHDPVPEMYIAKFGRRGLFYQALRVAEKLTYRTADLAISTNESHREIAIRRGGKRPEDVYVVRSGPNLAKFVKTEPDASCRRGRRFLVGYVGVMGEPEGIDLLLQSVRHIVFERKRDDIHFVLMGEGPLTEAMKKMARELEVGDHVEFTGRVPDTDMIRILSTCDVCVNPDRKSDYNDRCTMNKILEYMALEKPIVQYDLVEGRRSAEGASLYARADDAADFAGKILDLLADPDRRAEMGREGRRRMEERLEWKHQAKTLLSVYERIFT